MCDTFGKLGSRRFFAKNSDRSPNEIQVPEYHSGATGLTGQVQCTYISIPQAPETYAVLLSRPSWMWGAEMGVNEWGLCIGNEAVFTKGAYGRTGLTGMDLVRLALERCRTAKEALELILSLLESWGQGGNCGFDHNFYYDNAFLIQDGREQYVLQTAGKEWVYKRYDAVSISNGLSIGADGDGYSGTPCDFAGKYTEPVYTTFSGSRRRRGQTGSCLAAVSGVEDCIRTLSLHEVDNPFRQGSVGSVCMHFGGLVGDHSTASMVAAPEAGGMVVWSTGSSAPCVSLFKPWLFGTEPVAPVVAPGDPAGEAYWLEAEKFRRQLLGRKLPGEYFARRQQLQQQWIRTAASLDAAAFPEFSRACLEEERQFFAGWNPESFETCPCAPGFRGRWAKKNAVLFPEK